MHREPNQAGWLALAITMAVAGCQGAVGSTVPPTPLTTPAPPTSAASLAASSTAEPTAEPEPTRLSPTTEVPEGYRRGATVPFAIGLVAGDVLLSGGIDDQLLVRRDARTFEELGREQLGERDNFPPNLQSMFLGSEGVWVTLGFDHAVVLLDPETGEITRRVEILGGPYDVFESDGELWIADFGWGQITRYDLETDTEVAVIRGVQGPTDIIVGEGAAWAPAHIGRAEADEPISAGGYMVRIDLATNKVSDSPKVGPRPYYLAAGFGAAWTGTATGGSVDRVDAVTGEVTTILIGEDGAFDIEIVGDSVWAVVGPQWPIDRQCDPATSYFVRIDPSTRQVRELVAFPCANSITPMGEGFWVSGDDGSGPMSTYFDPIESAE